MSKEMGRPTIKLTDLPKEWDKMILELAEEGASIIELAVALDISRSTFYEISEREPDFSDTVKRCKELSEAWWVRTGRKNLMTKDFSYTGWYMNMKNRFNWADKKEIKGSVDVYKRAKDLFPSEDEILGNNEDA